MLPSHYSGYACYLLPSSLSTGERVSLATVFSTMHTHSSDMGITDWGIGQVGGLCVWGPVHVCAVAHTWLSTCNVSL